MGRKTARILTKRGDDSRFTPWAGEVLTSATAALGRVGLLLVADFRLPVGDQLIRQAGAGRQLGKHPACSLYRGSPPLCGHCGIRRLKRDADLVLGPLHVSPAQRDQLALAKAAHRRGEIQRLVDGGELRLGVDGGGPVPSEPGRRAERPRRPGA